jgi:GNAT superfamily N-acetyltransferase
MLETVADNTGRAPTIGPAELRDGTVVMIEPMHRTDAARLDSFHHTLSPETTRLRFFHLHPELSEREIERFTHVDHEDREALVAVHDDRIIGVARFDRMGDGSNDAEVAFVVADAWQGRGLGTVLFRRLAARAVEQGVRRLIAETLFRNRRMLAVFRHAGLPCTETLEGDVVRVVLDLAPAGPIAEQPVTEPTPVTEPKPASEPSAPV